MRPSLLAFGLVAAMPLAASCMDLPADSSVDTSALRIRGVIARIGPAGLGVVYMTITSAETDEDRLLAASSPSAAAVEMHETVESGDVTRMIPRPEGFVIAPGGTLTLAPLGKHLMVSGAPGAPASLPLFLRFAMAGEVVVIARTTDLFAGE